MSIASLEFLLFFAALVAVFARKTKLPYTVGLVLVGILLSISGAFSHVSLTGDLIFSVFLPPLLFEASFALRWKDLKKDLVPIGVLATLGVAIAMAVIAAGMHFFAGWDWPSSLLFGSLIAATDPVSVIAVFKESGVKGRLSLLVESESLLNDGIAAVVFGVVLAWVSGQQMNGTDAAIGLITEIFGGLAIGLGVGGACLLLIGRTSDHLVELTLTTVAAYGSFLGAQYWHTSGVLATVSCALLMGNFGALGTLTDRGREAVDAFWEFGGFVANSLIFLLIGVQGNRLASRFAGALPALGIATALLLASRALSVYPICAGFRWSRWRVGAPEQHVLFWGGLRGALALALVLGLPGTVARRDEILTMTFGAVAISIVLQGLTMPFLLKKLGLRA